VVTPLYVASSETACGSTTLCAGIGKKLMARKKVGFLIPVRFHDAKATGDPLSDAAFFKEVFQLPQDIEQICPLVLSPAELWQYLTEDLPDFSQKLQQIYQDIARGKDMVIMEGLGNLINDKVSQLACYSISEALGAKVVIVLRYTTRPETARLIHICRKLGQSLLGVVINLTPESKIEGAKQHLARQFQESGIPVLGILPQIRSLLGITVAELSKALGAELMPNNGDTNALIENIMLGAATSGSGVDYFAHKDNKAVILKADRPDMQLAALQTSLRCLVLVGATSKPSPAVLSAAEEKRVPIIAAGKKVPQVLADIEKALEKVSFAHPEKLQKLSNILESHFDFATLYAKLGIETR